MSRPTPEPLQLEVPDEGHQLEALYYPGQRAPGVLVCHPHPAFGGTMEVPLIRRLAEEAAAAGRPTLRFNFRGIGASGGTPTGGSTEYRDVLAAAAWLAERSGGLPPLLAGYSFGALMALAAITVAEAPDLSPDAPHAPAGLPHPLGWRGVTSGLCCIGVPTRLGAFTPARVAAIRACVADGCPLWLVSGDQDRFCEVAWLEEQFVAPGPDGEPGAELLLLRGQSHFFEGEQQVERAVALTRPFFAADAGPG